MSMGLCSHGVLLYVRSSTAFISASFDLIEVSRNFSADFSYVKI